MDEFGLIIDIPLDNKISSVRFIGNPTSGVGIEDINIFTNRNFAGIFENAVTDLSSMPATGGSVIINGCSPWSVFTEENYGGECACLINFSQV